jgi:hypothetical protein
MVSALCYTLGYPVLYSVLSCAILCTIYCAILCARLCAILCTIYCAISYATSSRRSIYQPQRNKRDHTFHPLVRTVRDRHFYVPNVSFWRPAAPPVMNFWTRPRPTDKFPLTPQTINMTTPGSFSADDAEASILRDGFYALCDPMLGGVIETFRTSRFPLKSPPGLDFMTQNIWLREVLPPKSS